MNDLRICPKCNGRTNTYRHPNAKIWCNDCGYVIREEGHPTPKYIKIKETYKK